MRKVLLFLALFALGLGALLLLRERVHKPSSSGDRSVPPVTSGQFTKIPLPPENPGQEQAPLEFVQRGAIDVTEFEGEGDVKKPVRKLHANDSQSLGGNIYVLRDMTAQDLDPESGKTTALITSPKTRLKIELLDGRLHIGEAEKAVLTDVEATIFARAAVTPLTLKVPLLEWRVAAKRWLSDRPVELSGSGLQAHGEGLDADLEAGNVVLPRSGRIELALPGDTRATLLATGEGPIEFHSLRRDDQDFVQIVASKGARLSAIGAELSHLDAEGIQLLARSRAGEKKEFELVSIDAQGHVVAESRGDTFRADAASFRVTPTGRLEHGDLDGGVSLESVEGKVRGAKAVFDFAATGRPEKAHVEQDVVIERGEDVFRAGSADFQFAQDGKLVKATLVGEPTGRVAIGRYLPAGERELRSAHPEVTGAGPLELDFTHGTTFRLAGPGDVKIPEADLRLHAEKSLAGEAGADGKSADLIADGDVVVGWKGDDFASQRVHLTTATSEPGETIVEAEGSGPTTVHRKREDGSTLTVTAEDGLQARSKGKRIVVPLARGVTISTTGPDALEARAATVRDFDWEARSFLAEGDVVLEGTTGRGSADRALARGPGDLELTGSPSRPARYAKKAGKGEVRFEEASIQGLSIRAQEDSLDAAGEVRADFAAARETYHLRGGEVHVTFGKPESSEAGAPRPFEAHASSAVRAQIDTMKGESSVSCERLRVAGTTMGASRPDERPNVAASEIRAEGSVVVDWREQGGVTGVGDLFTLDPQGRGHLSAAPGQRVHASGRMAGDTIPYSLVADWFEFEKERLEARRVDVHMEPPGSGPEVAGAERAAAASARTLIAHISADHLLVTTSEALLEGSAHIDGRSEQNEDWAIDAGSVKIDGAFTVKKGVSPAEFDLVRAWDGFKARLGVRAVASGRTLEGKPGRIRLDGDPAELALSGIAMRSAWIEYDAENMLLATDKGEIGPPKDAEGGWSITYESLQPFEREDKSILALRNPVYHDGEREMRALWMLFWVDREEWRRSGRKALNETTSGPDLRVKEPDQGRGRGEGGGGAVAADRATSDRSQSKLAKLRANIARFRADPLSKVLSEAYIEGNIELTDKGQRVARASAVYLDIVEGHGWVREADVLEDVTIRDKPQQLRVRAGWMRVSSDLSLRADKATLSFCGHDEPHYVVETGDLRLKPNGEGIQDFDVSATSNTLRFENGWAIPLPPLIYAKDEQGNPIIENLSLGQSAKFGASVGATFNVGLGKIGNGLGGIFGKILSLPKASVKGSWRFHADFLGTRGILLGTGLELRSGDRFKMNADFSFIPDRSEDRGVVRVPKDDRTFLRDWFRARGRYTLSKDEWFDLAVSRQSDPGVQSEFFERDYFRYEQKDNYLHWRKANGEWYLSSSAKVRLENRTDIEELPKFGVFRGRAPIANWFGLDLLYTGSMDAAYLRRRDGDPQFNPAFPDPYGDRDVARADTEHRIEAPFSLGFAGTKATPWVSGRATVWDRSIRSDTSPSRSGALAGFDLSTTFWKRYGSGYLHSISPFVSVHGDVASEESLDAPVHFDRTEDPIEGRFFDVGLRTRVWKPETQAHFDAEIRATHAANLPGGAPDGLPPVAVLSELLTWIGKIPVGITHDGRYDLDSGDTAYSRTFLGLRPFSAWDVEFGYHRGVDPFGVLLYEAASAATRYRASEKWEIELGETLSVLDDGRLDSRVTLRRLGHDFVTETEIGYTAGEGTRFSINLTPLITWRPSGIGLLDRWLGR